jgi:hypothetical protein
MATRASLAARAELAAQRIEQAVNALRSELDLIDLPALSLKDAIASRRPEERLPETLETIAELLEHTVRFFGGDVPDQRAGAFDEDEDTDAPEATETALERTETNGEGAPTEDDSSAAAGRSRRRSR